MNLSTLILRMLLLAVAPLLCHCTSLAHKSRKPVPAAVTNGNAKTENANKNDTQESGAPVAADDLDEYAVVEISDPFERINRGTFWVNDKLYLVILRPISKGYEKVVPKPARRGIDNAFANVKFPVRFVNHVLQGKFKRAGLETEKFIVNTVAGIGGLFRVSDKMPSLADLPEQDTGMTFAKWGMGHGAYVVIPILGPSSIRDGIGLLGDNALNPVNWGVYGSGNHDWTKIPPYANTLRALPNQMSLYDSAKEEAIDPYIAIRSAYVQYRAESLKK